MAPALKAAFWMAGAIASFSSMALAGREVTRSLSTFELMFYRSAIGLVLVLGWAALGPGLARLATRRPGLHLARNLSHFAGQNFWFYAIATIPLAQVVAFEFTTPLWVALLAPIFLHERLTARRAVAVLIGFCGMLLVARPGPDGVSAGMIAALCAALGFAGSALATKRLTATEPVWRILFWLALMQLVFSALIVGRDLHVPWPAPGLWPFLVVIGITGLTAHLCLTSALATAPAVIVMPIDFLRLPTVAILGMIFYDEPLVAIVFIGAGIIFAANLANLRAEIRGIGAPARAGRGA